MRSNNTLYNQLLEAKHIWESKTYNSRSQWYRVNIDAKARNLDGINKMLDAYKTHNHFTGRQRTWVVSLINGAKR